MRLVEVAPFYLAIVPGFFAVFLGFVVLLPLLEEPMRCIVMREVPGSGWIVG